MLRIRAFADVLRLLILAAMAAMPVASLAQAQAQAQAPVPPAPEALPVPAEAVFENRIPVDQMAFLKPFEGLQTGDLVRDKQMKRLLHNEIPGWMFHYGHDLPLPEAVGYALENSAFAVEIRDGRYLSAVGRSGADPRLWGRAMIWCDLQEGIFLGAFSFRPSNGEPSPTVTVFSRQLRVDVLSMSQLPAAFSEDMARWLRDSGVRPLTTRYFIGDLPQRILLAHDEDYCVPNAIAAPSVSVCQQMNAEAADVDLNAAYYLEQVNYATNATARMVTGGDQTTFIALREQTCGVVIACRIRLTRERVRVVVVRRPVRVVVARRR